MRADPEEARGGSTIWNPHQPIMLASRPPAPRQRLASLRVDGKNWQDRNTRRELHREFSLWPSQVASTASTLILSHSGLGISRSQREPSGWLVTAARTSVAVGLPPNCAGFANVPVSSAKKWRAASSGPPRRSAGSSAARAESSALTYDGSSSSTGLTRGAARN